MDGLIMDYQLNVPAILRRAEQLFGRQGDRQPAARQELPPLHLRRLASRATKRLAVALRRARPRRRRPRRRRSPGTTTSTSRRTSGSRPAAWSRTRSTCASTPTTSPTSRPRGRPGPDRRQGALAARRAVRRPRGLRARDRRRPGRDAADGAIDYEELLASAEPAGDLSRTSTSEPRRRCATRAAPPAGRRASSTRTARSCSTRSPRRRPARSGSASATSCCRSCRCSTRTPGASRSRARWSAREQVFPGPHLDPPSLLEAFVQERGDGDRRRADDLDGHPAALDAEPRRLGPLARCGR